jgi:F-type H+-transporting ATPase subunit delta
MNYGKIAQRYSKALFEFAEEKNQIEEIKADMLLCAKVSKENIAFKKMLKSPVIRSHKKLQVVEAIFKSKVQTTTLEFFKILIKKGREEFIEDIALSYITLYKIHHGIKIAYIETAVELPNAAKEKIIKLLEKETSSKIEMQESINTDLIGGFRLTVEDKQFDASIQKKIKKLTKEFSKNIYIREF